jgi:excisionase family DNA binding protein
MTADSPRPSGERAATRRSNAGSTLTVDEAREIIGVDRISRGGLYNAIKKNEVPHLKLGRRVLIPRAALMLWLEAGHGAGNLPKPPEVAHRTTNLESELAGAARQLADLVEVLIEALELVAATPKRLRKAVDDVRAALEKE